MLNNQVIDAALSGPDGSYYFSNVMPGSYQVEAEHPNMKFSTV
jgi:protocatechuate 3,4-dioxygenase beta subunit